MLVASSPAKFNFSWAYNQPNTTYNRPIPITTTDVNAASLALGFPPNTFVQLGAGGEPPNGADENGILSQITLWLQWFNGGGPIFYDSVWAGANGGYPQWAALSNATTPGLFWISTVDNNVTDPDTGGAGWIAFPSFQTAATAADIQAGASGANANTRVVTPGPLQGSAGFQVLTDANTIVWDAASGYNAECTLTSGVGSTRQLGTPSGLADGLTYEFDAIQGAGGNLTLTYAAIFDFGSAAAPTLSTAAGKTDVLIFSYRALTGKLRYIGATLGL